MRTLARISTHALGIVFAVSSTAPLLGQASRETPRPAAPSASALVSRSPSPFFGSVPAGTASDDELALTLSDAIARGLDANLGAIDSRLDSRLAESQRQRALSALLPQLETTVRQFKGELALVTFGFELPGLPPVIGPFSYQDARVGVSQELFNLHSLRTFQAARESAKAAQLAAVDARDIVVLAVGAAYFQLVADQARVATAEARLKAAHSLEELAGHQVDAGVAPDIDRLRATVQRQTDEQRLAVVRAAFEKDKIGLGRLIGLPSGQRLKITTPVDFAPWTGPQEKEAIATALGSRSDYKSAEAAVHAAELNLAAAKAEHLPTVGIGADYGRVGKTLATTDGTFTLNAVIGWSLWNGGRSAAAEAQAQAVLDRRRAELADYRGRLDAEVRAAFLDLDAAQTSVEVAKQSVELAEKVYEQATDRFKNGVTNNIEVVLAAESVVAAHENYTASLFSHNFSKLSLLRAMGLAEQGVARYLSGSPGGK